MNKKILEELTKQYGSYKHDKATVWKAKALAGAIQKIKELAFEITNPAIQLAGIKGFGKGIIGRIEKILKDGTLNTQSTTLMDTFCSITGVGPARAKEWMEIGIKSLDEAVEGIECGRLKSTHHIDIGIKYYHDFLIRIPRKEIQKMEIALTKVLKSLDANCELTICGSYRRGCKDSGDIDMIITNPKITDNIQKHKYLTTFVKKLKEIGFIIDDLTSLGEKKYMGVCKLPKHTVARRIDIRCFNYAEYYAAMLYFTGSKNFNVQMRNVALDKGYSLNEYGLKKDKKLIMLHSEEECFDLLGMEYKDPEERNI